MRTSRSAIRNTTIGALWFGSASLACLILLAGPGLAWPRQDGSPTKIIRIAQKIGAESWFKLTMRIDSHSPGAHKIEILEKYKVSTTEANPNGAWAQVTRFDLTTVNIRGKAMDMLASMPVVTVSRSSSGTFSVKSEAGNAEGNAEIAGALQQIAAMPDILTPTRDVKPGDRWKIAFQNSNLMMGAERLSGAVEYAGHEKIGAVDTVKLLFKAEGSGTTAARNLKTVGIVNLDAETGALITLKQKGNGMFAGAPADVELEVTRLSSE